MKKFISRMLLGLGLIVSTPVFADATVFGHFTKNDNGDSCLEPTEVHDVILQKQSTELIITINNDEELNKLKDVLVAANPGTTKEDFLFNLVEVYKDDVLAPDTRYIVIYMGVEPQCLLAQWSMPTNELQNIFDKAFGPGYTGIGGVENLYFTGHKGFNPKKVN